MKPIPFLYGERLRTLNDILRFFFCIVDSLRAADAFVPHIETLECQSHHFLFDTKLLKRGTVRGEALLTCHSRKYTF